MNPLSRETMGSPQFDYFELFDYFIGLLQNNFDESVNDQELNSQEPFLTWKH